MSEELDAYISRHIDPEPDYLYRLWRATNLHLLNGRMASGHLQGRLLRMLVAMIRPQRVLEAGTFSGYSALCMAEALPEGGHLWTFDVDDELEDFTRPWIEQSPWADRITYSVGDASLEAPKLGITFDLVFIDSDKRRYVEMYESAIKMTKNGGFIVADNTLWDGHIVDPDYDRDHQTRGIARFNDHVADDERVEKVILPLRDGLTLIRKKP